MPTPPSPHSFRLLSDEEREASRQASFSQWNTNDDVWVFGYGSLIWRPEFHFTESHSAVLHGYHRSLCLWSRVNRGTPEQPGLVFGLDLGGSCKGVAYRIAAAHVPHTMQALWHREMPSGAYLPRWLACRTPHGAVQALTFVMNRHTDVYARNLPLDTVARVVHHAHGRNGPCIEYVMETAQALKQHNIHDRRLQTIVQHLNQFSMPLYEQD